MLMIPLTLCLFASAEVVTADATIDCPSFAQKVLCKENVVISSNSTLDQEEMAQCFRYDSRRVSPGCPLSCQVCDWRPRDNNIVSRDEFAHCYDGSREDINVWKPGDPDKMFEHIANDFPEYSPSVLSSPELNGGPWIITLENFLTLQECQAMIQETKQAIEEAGEEESLAQDEADEDSGECMSTQAWCSDECMETQALQSVKTKVEQLVGMPWKYAEELHFIQYIPGQRYGSHHDYIDQEAESLHGPRLWTILFYLNDLDGNGGETCFPALNDLCIKPKLGRALLWPQVLNDNPEARDNSTWHEAKEISEGFKFASTVWYHLRDYERSNELGCIDTFQDDDEEEDEDDDYDDDDDTGEDSEIEK